MAAYPGMELMLKQTVEVRFSEEIEYRIAKALSCAATLLIALTAATVYWCLYSLFLT